MLHVVGSFTTDRITPASGEPWVAAGGSAMYAGAAAGVVAGHFGLPMPRVAAPAGNDNPVDMDLLGKVADVSGVDVLDGNTFCWDAVYGPDGGRTESVDMGVSAGWMPRVDGTWEGCTLMLATMDPDVALSVIMRAGAKRVVFDTIGYWARARPAAVRRVLGRVDVACVSHAEASLITGRDSHETAARELSGMGPDVVVVKVGERGCVLYRDGLAERLPPFPAGRVLDATGAGDAFAGAMSAALDGGFGVREAAEVGCVLGSFAVGGRGASGLLGPGVAGRFAECVGRPLAGRGR